MFLLSSPNIQRLLPQTVRFRGPLPGSLAKRIGLRNGKEVQQVSTFCHDLVKQIPEEKWSEIVEDVRRCVPRKVLRQKRLTFPLNGTSSLVVIPGNFRIHIQQRGFHTPNRSNGLGKLNSKKESTSRILSLFGFSSSESVEFKEQLEKHRKSSGDVAFQAGYILRSQEMDKKFSDLRKSGFVKFVYRALFATIFLYFILLAMIKWATGGGSSVRFVIGDNASEVKPEEITVTFADVRGNDEAKNEVTEIVDYLREPDKYTRLGGRLPKGVLLVGPPGTGKTLLARAIAGEARVPFFHVSGSEFEEVLVGQGARRIRDLFKKAKVKAPCIIFIDEIDSIGSKRVSDGLHPYANQTINQLLNEMDGFKRNEGVIVLGATNRVEDLDKALLRPGRFDSRVNVSIPDFTGRKEIFELYLNRITHGRLSLDTLAKGTIGFSGADIENMVNQAALKAATQNCDQVFMRHLEEAKDRILMGPARVKGRIPDEETNKNTAWHEAGHALVALYTKDAQPIHKVTIIKRGPSLGHTAFLPDAESYQVTRSQLMAQLDVLMGGRVAEELSLGKEKVTTGASDDLRKATKLALRIVKQYGMGPALRDYTVKLSKADIGPQTMEKLDKEVNQLLEDSYNRAKEILTNHKDEHKLLSDALFEYETLTSNEVKQVIKGEKIKRRSESLLPNILSQSSQLSGKTTSQNTLEIQLQKGPLKKSNHEDS